MLYVLILHSHLEVGRGQSSDRKGVTGIDRYEMDPAWNPVSRLLYLVLWAGVSGVACTLLGVKRKNSNISRRIVVLVDRRKPFRTVSKVFNMNHFLEKCYVSGVP